MNSKELSKQKKSVPTLYQNRETCCGCSACMAICPKEAITMLPDEEGFLYPVIDEARCICCYQCLSVCAFQKNISNEE